MGAGDLFDGADAERNAALSALKSAFFGSSELDAQQPVAKKEAAKLGLLLDVPLARWGFNILPHHREPAAAAHSRVGHMCACGPADLSLARALAGTVLNVFQPQYTLMFERLLSGPQPWIYLHVLLPGGVENIANPEYALVPGSKAPLAGTLMQVMAVQREADSRLTLLVHGVGRGVVLRATQVRAQRGTRARGMER